MKGRIWKFTLALVVSAMILSGCGLAMGQPKVEVPDGVIMARDVVIAHLQNLGDMPLQGLSWTAENVTPKDIVGAETYQFVSGGWTVTVVYPIVLPELTVYTVTVANSASGFSTELKVDADGQIQADVPTPVPALNPVAPRDAAMDYIRLVYGIPAEQLNWVEEELTPSARRYTAGNWDIVVQYPSDGPEATIFIVTVDNAELALHWVGQVTAKGDVQVAPEQARNAMQAALAFLRDKYGDEVPAVTLTWLEQNVTEGYPDKPVLGYSKFAFLSDDWTVTVGFPIVAPGLERYDVEVANSGTGAYWHVEVDAEGNVSDLMDPDVKPVVVPDAAAARDLAMAFLAKNDPMWPGAAPDLVWTEEVVPSQGMVGSSALKFTAGDWWITISYPIVRPDLTVYQVIVDNTATAFHWEGQVTAQGQVSE